MDMGFQDFSQVGGGGIPHATANAFQGKQLAAAFPDGLLKPFDLIFDVFLCDVVIGNRQTGRIDHRRYTEGDAGGDSDSLQDLLFIRRCSHLINSPRGTPPPPIR